MRMKVGLEYLSRMSGESDDRRTQSFACRFFLYLFKQEAVTPMYAVKETNGGSTGRKGMEGAWGDCFHSNIFFKSSPMW